ncbi:D-beta-hydroxybutyrate dehydrogenase, mitochondrial [Bacillus rossius redtenbacheri]|uniref:D-beta-hydroxybutyrate dehydrogenase, mitochondrial n=1 Tax=Bacillus rossius redtenbacheri TaxID=93214 RepID=UPI002FDD6655
MVAGRQEEVPWDLFDRCLLPVVFSHAAAVIISSVLNLLSVSRASTFAVFLWLLVAVLAAVFFYHNLKVTVAGKALLITGCESPLGYTAARHLDELGFTVFAGFAALGDRSRRLKEAASGRLHVLQLDVSRESDVQAALQYVLAHLPPGAAGLWAVVNNASWSPFGEVEWVPFSVYRRAVDVNLLGVVRVSQAFLPLLRRTKGRVINMASIQGRIPSPFKSAHCLVKAAVEAFSECLRLEMRRWGVDVIIVEPGNCTSWSGVSDEEVLSQARDMWRAMSDELRAEYGEDCFEQQVLRLRHAVRSQTSDCSAVLSSLTDAASRTFPMPRYTPVTWSEKLQALVATHLPRSVYDVLYT